MTHGYFTHRLQELVNADIAQHGGLGILGLTPAANKDATVEDIAHDAVRMHESFLAGNYTDITNQGI